MAPNGALQFKEKDASHNALPGRGKPLGISRTKALLVTAWLLVIWWGERMAFSSHISHCNWRSWEQWPSNADPHRMVLVADPQLVDPHTYPGRPSALYSLTVRHTDKYMRRSFGALLDGLVPDTVFFLGDLFDGGREWVTGNAKSSEERWKRFGDPMWFKEYDRLSKIFFAPWRRRLEATPTTRPRKLVASLPGNHDLGFGGGIQLAIRERFTTFFGSSNRIEIVGNHTFVSIDSVSLSAKQEFKERENTSSAIWSEAESFLGSIADEKLKLLDRQLRTLHGLPENNLQNHTVQDLGNVDAAQQWGWSDMKVTKDMPAVLLSHVPLWRNPGTPCGPLREKWPPSTSTSTERDDRNAIAVAFGEQYQNVIAHALSKHIVQKVGNLQHAFSGDDHDYCEVIHKDLDGPAIGVREVTVKAFSWAMGIRRPGFLMVSLWNPVDETGASLPRGASKGTAKDGTLQSHLCLLPDQLGTFIRYGLMFGVTLLALAFRTLQSTRSSAAALELKSPLLPLSTPSTPGSAAGVPGKIDAYFDSYASSSVPADAQQATARATNGGARPRHVGGLAPIDEGDSVAEARTPKDRSRFLPAQRRSSRRARLFWYELVWSLAQVALLPGLLYWYLA